MLQTVWSIYVHIRLFAKIYNEIFYDHILHTDDTYSNTYKYFKINILSLI